MRRQYEVSEELSERLLALLKQVTGQEEPRAPTTVLSQKPAQPAA